MVSPETEATPSGEPKRLISIVIPTHNRLDLVKEAIETVRRQTGNGRELIVFDNASTESVVSYVESLNDHVFGVSAPTTSFP